MCTPLRHPVMTQGQAEETDSLSKGDTEAGCVTVSTLLHAFFDYEVGQQASGVTLRYMGVPTVD